MPIAHHLNKIAPVNLHSPRSYQEMSNGTSNEDEFFTFTVGKLDAGMAILIGDRASQIEFPSLLLPQECTTGSVVRISVSRNQKEEQRKKREFDALQDDVLEMFGRRTPVGKSFTWRIERCISLTQTDYCSTQAQPSSSHTNINHSRVGQARFSHFKASQTRHLPKQ
jgi:hypothetical protein